MAVLNVQLDLQSKQPESASLQNIRVVSTKFFGPPNEFGKVCTGSRGCGIFYSSIEPGSCAGVKLILSLC